MQMSAAAAIIHAAAALSSPAAPASYVVHFTACRRSTASLLVPKVHVCVCVCVCAFSSSLRHFPAHVLDAKRCLHERGFAFVPAFGEGFAREYIGLMGEDVAKRKKQTIAGGVEQFAMPQTGGSPWPTKLRAQWHALVAQLAQHAGVDSEQLQQLIGGNMAAEVSARPQLHVQDEKLLVAGRQRGEQALHFDR